MCLQKGSFRRALPVFFALVFLALAIGIAYRLGAPDRSQPVGSTDSATGPQGGFSVQAYFEENRGQDHEEVRFRARARGYDLFLTPSEAVYSFSAPSVPPEESGAEGRPAGGTSSTIRMSLAGNASRQVLQGSGQLPGEVNYFLGSDRNKWRSGVPTFSEVRAADVYPGIDLIWKGSRERSVRYDFVVSPGVSPERISWEIEHAEDVQIDADGSLLFRTPAGTLRHKKPSSYQEIDGALVPVESDFVLDVSGEKANVSFKLGPYDRSRELVIDPTIDLGILGSSSYIGGSGRDEAHAIYVDEDGNIYVAGNSISSDFPTTPGSFDPTWNQARNIFISKFRPDGRTLIFSTFLGGAGGSEFGDMRIDDTGNIFVAGFVFADSFPTTKGAFDESYNGDQDAVVAKLDPTGSSLVYSTYFGGAGSDVALGIDFDSSGGVYFAGVTGEVGSATFPVTDGAFDTTINGLNDGFLAKLSADGSTLEYCTFLGSSMFDNALDVAVDDQGRAVVVGKTGAGDFPVTKGSFDTTFDVADDAFVTKFVADGSGLVFSTFVGGSGGDTADSVVVDGDGNIFVTGHTSSSAPTAFPTTPLAFDTTHNGINDAFVFKMTPDGTDLIYSTLLGGSLNDWGFDIAIDQEGNAYITGKTSGGSPVFPTTAGAFDETHNGFEDGYAAKISADGSSLLYSTFFGAGNDETSNGVAVDKFGNMYIAGMTRVDGIPTTPKSFDPTFNGNDEGFFASFGCRRPKVVVDFDCDGETDMSVFRTSNGVWFSLRSNEGFFGFQFGSPGDIPIPGDYDGDKREDAAVFRPSDNPGEPDFYILNSSDLSVTFVELGVPGDIPVNGDFDADGRDDIGVFRPSEGRWYIVKSSDQGIIEEQFGQEGDIPVRMDFNGDSQTDLAVFRPDDGTWYIARPEGPPAQNFDAVPFGISTDIPVAADYDGDYRTDIAVFRPSNGVWYLLKTSDWTVDFVQFGISSDLPVPGDYDGDGLDDIGIYRDGTWWLLQSTEGIAVRSFGVETDIPLTVKSN
ncbi:MAG TPA: SBBP repeat-containing protein [Aridibacter sp.]|nr:SBBP repeat-containing protein [Aridibacter sp.]